MRMPDFDADGWSLEDAEAREAANPDTFQIPPREMRDDLEPGDFAQLIFRIALDDDDEEEEAFERMWVIVNERRADGGYMGILNNEPGSIAENEAFWAGAELPFEARQVIDLNWGNDASIEIALAPPRRRWDRAPPS